MQNVSVGILIGECLTPPSLSSIRCLLASQGNARKRYIFVGSAAKLRRM